MHSTVIEDALLFTLLMIFFKISMQLASIMTIYTVQGTTSHVNMTDLDSD